MNNVTEISEAQMRTYINRAHTERAKAFSSAFAALSAVVVTIFNGLLKHGDTDTHGRAAGAH